MTYFYEKANTEFFAACRLDHWNRMTRLNLELLTLFFAFTVVHLSILVDQFGDIIVCAFWRNYVKSMREMVEEAVGV